jgi:hypothetical protein
MTTKTELFNPGKDCVRCGVRFYGVAVRCVVVTWCVWCPVLCCVAWCRVFAELCSVALCCTLCCWEVRACGLCGVLRCSVSVVLGGWFSCVVVLHVDIVCDFYRCRHGHHEVPSYCERNLILATDVMCSLPPCAWLQTSPVRSLTVLVYRSTIQARSAPGRFTWLRCLQKTRQANYSASCCCNRLRYAVWPCGVDVRVWVLLTTSRGVLVHCWLCEQRCRRVRADETVVRRQTKHSLFGI